MATANGGLPNAGVGSLFTLIKRLEAATSRLEDIAIAQGGGSTTGLITSSPDPGAPTAAAAATAAVAANDPATPSVAAYDALLAGPLATYLAAADKVGSHAHEQAQAVAEAFRAQRAFLALAATCRKPAADALMELLKPTSHPLNRAVEVKDRNRADRKLFNGLSAIAEGIPALAWVAVDAKPAPVVGESKDSAQFWANRVLKEFKDADPAMVDWPASFIALLDELKKYVLQHHATSLTWNPNGEDATAKASSTPTSAASTASAAAPPPPPPPPPGPPAPPPPPPPPAPSSSSGSAAGGGGMGAVFASINQGEGVTSGLRKVDPSEMTHKNPGLRGTASSGAGVATGKPAKPPKPQGFQKKPPKKQLDGNKWTVEYFENDNQIVVDGTDISHLVNVYGCKNATVVVKGKVNAVTLVGCSRTSVLVDSLVASLSITSSPSFTVQVLGKVPTIQVDATDGGQIYLSKESLGVEIVTAKTSALNVSLPVEGEDAGVFEEKAVPEQLKTVVRDGKLVTTVLEHTG